MINKLRTLLLLLLFCGVAIFAYIWVNLERQATTPLQLPQEPVDYQLSPGTTVNRLAEDLQHRGWIKSATWFSYWVRLQDDGGKIKAGLYQLTPGMTGQDLLDLFVSGRVRTFSITFVEGMTSQEVLAKVANAPWIKQTLKDHSPSAVLAKLSDGQYNSLEGLLYPDTYYYHAGETDIKLLQRSYRRLQKVLAQEWEGRAKNLPYETAYKALIMASIVEKETGVPSERAEIAGVFVRRLEKRMRLQTDPTVIYGMGDSFDGRLSRKNLRTPTPYNTYIIRGLPPTPIALVGRAAIHAALHPADGDTLYFVAKGDGSHDFSVTLTEHNRAVRKYQLNRRSDYRSSPEPNQD